MESLKKNLEEGQYGRCVYFCDNNVVDHQVVNMLFDDDLMITGRVKKGGASCSQDS